MYYFLLEQLSVAMGIYLPVCWIPNLNTTTLVQIIIPGWHPKSLFGTQPVEGKGHKVIPEICESEKFGACKLTPFRFK